MATPTAHEQYVLELVNRARLDPLAEAARYGIDLNQGLSSGTLNGTAKQPLAFNPLLIDAARDHSDWIIATDTFSHTGANGSSPGDRMKAAGYTFSGSWTWGENIALRSGTITGSTAELLHEQLFESPGHRVNLLNGNFREAGFGLSQGPYKGYTATALTENFAKSGSSVFLVGVTFDDSDGDRFYDPGEGLGDVALSIRNVSTGAVTNASTWSSGGYQLSLAPGSYEVTFSGGGLDASVKKSVTIGSSNMKLDLNADDVAASPPPPPPPEGQVLTGTNAGNLLAGGAGADLIDGRAGADTLSGGGGADTLLGAAGKDRMDGGAGDDVLIGGGGLDTLAGGDGADRFVFQNFSTDRGDRITDFNAVAGDRVDISDFLSAGAGDSWAELSASGHARLTKVAAGTMLWVDRDGDGDAYYQVVTFEGRTAAQLGTDFLLG